MTESIYEKSRELRGDKPLGGGGVVAPQVWLPGVGRALFCSGLAAFGVLSLMYGDFIAGRAPAWPEGWPGRMVWSGSTGVVFVGAAVALWTGRRARLAALTAGVLVWGWAWVRLLPLVVEDAAIGGTWTWLGKATVILGGLAALAWTDGAERQRARGLWAGRISLGLFMTLCGLQHFRWQAFVVTLVPGWVPGGGVFWTQVTGVLLVLGGLGLLIPRTTRLAAGWSGLMIFLWVFMVHLPRALAATDGGQGEWTAVFEALAFSGLALVYRQDTALR